MGKLNIISFISGEIGKKIEGWIYSKCGSPTLALELQPG
jgi:hypothetical protein